MACSCPVLSCPVLSYPVLSVSLSREENNGAVRSTEASVVTALREVALKRQTKLMRRVKEALHECVVACCAPRVEGSSSHSPRQQDGGGADGMEWVSALTISLEYTGSTGQKHHDRVVTVPELLRASKSIRPSFFEDMVMDRDSFLSFLPVVVVVAVAVVVVVVVSSPLCCPCTIEACNIHAKFPTVQRQQRRML
jgi:hypothetical protein